MADVVKPGTQVVSEPPKPKQQPAKQSTPEKKVVSVVQPPNVTQLSRYDRLLTKAEDDIVTIDAMLEEAKGIIDRLSVSSPDNVPTPSFARVLEIIATIRSITAFYQTTQ